MSHIETYVENQKKRKLLTVMFLLFWIPALILPMLLEYEPFIITLSLKFIGLIFLYFAYKYSLCPNCGRNPGWGWKIKKCKGCGEQLV